VPADVVTAIREREHVGAFDQLDPRQSLKLGGLVRVTTGAFEDMVADWSNCAIRRGRRAARIVGGARCRLSSAQRWWKPPDPWAAGYRGTGLLQSAPVTALSPGLR